MAAKRDAFWLLALAFLLGGGLVVTSSKAQPAGSTSSPWTDDEMRAFLDLVRGMGIAPEVVLSVWHFESGLRTTAVNPSTKAQGLAQFMPDTLRGLGYRDDPLQFHTLSMLQQLPWLAALLSSQVKTLGRPPESAAKLMHLQLAPATAQASTVIFVRGSEGYAANNFDAGDKGYVDESDMARVVDAANGSAIYQAVLSQLHRIEGEGTA